MKKNLISALFLASIAYFSAACTTSSTDDLQSDETAADVDSQMNDKGDNDSAAQNKPAPPEAVVFAPDSFPSGASYEEWVAAYWQWVMSIPAEKNPIFDGPCEQKQSGSVFFLAGNTGGSHQRSCSIPLEAAIFVPLLSGVGRSCPELAENPKVCQEVTSEDTLRGKASGVVDSANALFHLSVDGRPIAVGSEFRIQSGVFADKSPENRDERLFDSCSGPVEANACGIEKGSSRDVIADGYFVMLDSLPAGEHVIHMAANVAPNSVEKAYEVTYTITVGSPNP